MKHKKLLIVLAVVVVMAVAATAAYAWWTSTDSLDGNSITTGTMDIDVQGQSGPMIVTGLVPSNGPNIILQDPWVYSDQDVDSENGFPSRFFWVRNSGNVPEMFYAWAEVTGHTWIADKVMVRIWLNPVDYPDPTDSSQVWKAGETYAVWEGPLSDIDSWTEGRDRIRTITPNGVKESIPAGKYALYKIVFWLDGSATNAYQGKSVDVELHVEGGQAEAWGSW
jgi:predicted ribosomally synthesized peptide with SipW-like signal peptide